MRPNVNVHAMWCCKMNIGFSDAAPELSPTRAYALPVAFMLRRVAAAPLLRASAAAASPAPSASSVAIMLSRHTIFSTGNQGQIAD